MGFLAPLGFLLIITCLSTALFFMLRGDTSATPNRSRKMAWALATRVGLSILLFLSILLAWKMGWIHPTGITSTASLRS